VENNKNIAIIGAGPAGLAAAEKLATAGCKVAIYDRMPNPARKFLIAGRGGLNLTHSEPFDKFITRYGSAANWLEPHIKAFSPGDLRDWAEGLGQETYVGSSGRVFPKAMKAAPLLRAWLRRLSGMGVEFYFGQNWLGFEGANLRFDKAGLVAPKATLLALGGASWPRLGSNGAWMQILQGAGVKVAPLVPSNCGFVVGWSDVFASKFAGTPLKSVGLNFAGRSQIGEVMITKTGLEGGAVYAISGLLRDEVLAHGKAVLYIDLRPNMSAAELAKRLAKPRGSESFSNYMRKMGFAPVAISLAREANANLGALAPERLAGLLKALPITLTDTSGLARAISSAGGIELGELDENLMLKKLPNVFACGEMLNWEAPTGGYLLQACFSTGLAAAQGILGEAK
jgi:uncharacterized flavoprotein (TIGR03862 family)